MNKEQRKELVIKKWQVILDNGGETDDLYELYEDNQDETIYEIYEAHEDLRYKCTYCEEYVTKDEDGDEICQGCPLQIDKSLHNYSKKNQLHDVLLKDCCQDKHPWSIWNDNPCEETALAMLNFIKER